MDIYVYLGNETQTAEFKAKPGTYKIECWGAEGYREGGKCGYVAGYITFKSTIHLYVFVGGNGTPGTAGHVFNGDGFSQNCGGGASDVRLINNTWDNFESLKSRIIVAGGGGGGDTIAHTGGMDNGGAAGGLNGKNSLNKYGKGGTQYPVESPVEGSGYFGKGGSNDRITGDGIGAGGGGYFGGSASSHQSNYGGGGGSSFISGHKGCVAIDPLSENENNIIMKIGESVHYSGHKFTDTKMYDGTSLMPSVDGEFETGHSGFGAVKITILSICIIQTRNIKIFCGCKLFFILVIIFVK